MSEWFLNNWLALYGAVIGTLAFTLNFFRFIHTKNKDKIKLALSISPTPNQEKNIESMNKKTVVTSYDPAIADIFSIKVRNIGNTDVFIEDVWVLCTKGVKYPASVNLNDHNNALKSKSSTNYRITISKGQNLFKPKRICVTDKSGGKWNQKV